MFNQGLGLAMLTLLQFLTMDSIGAIYRPLIVHRPVVLGCYFSAYILLVGIALMNLVIAVMVESSSQQAANDREGLKAWETARKKALIPKLKRMFAELDADGSGEVELEEIYEAPQELKE